VAGILLSGRVTDANRNSKYRWVVTGTCSYGRSAMCSPGRIKTCSAVSAGIAFSNGLPSFGRQANVERADGMVAHFTLRYQF
jgi:hypothetical protein